MFTSERIDRLCRTYGCQINCSGGCPICAPEDHGRHEIINAFDAAAGIDTSGGMRAAPLGRSGIVGHNYIGARLALHEDFLARGRRESAPLSSYYHWLGHEACCSCGCGEHKRTP